MDVPFPNNEQNLMIKKNYDYNLPIRVEQFANFYLYWTNHSIFNLYNTTSFGNRRIEMTPWNSQQFKTPA